ncbi:MAG: M43 family zinc metalloprotease, partial [Bacteroidota bacterium]
DAFGVLESNLKIEDLARNEDLLYDRFSHQHDLDSMITVYILDYKKEFCTLTNNSIRCSRTGGFSYILSSRTNNIVISTFDLKDPKTVAHEFGHFFGLYHTFEQNLFGKDEFEDEKCTIKGDLICDTPPDPGTIFEVYVNYSTCEMIGNVGPNGNIY